MSFNASVIADAAIATPDLFAAIAGNLTKAQRKEVDGIVSSRLAAKATATLGKSLVDGTGPKEVAAVADAMLALSVLVAAHGKHVPAKSEGGWSGRVVRLVTPHGGLKVTLTDR